MSRFVYLKSVKIVAVVLALSFLLCDSSVQLSNNTTNAAVISSETEWNIKTINAEHSYNESKNYKKIKVAVLDSGLDYDLNIPFVERKDFVRDGEESFFYQDSTGHGTSVSSIICATKNEDRITGIAANVELYVARILDDNNQSPVKRVIEAVNWAIEKKVNIIHMSFGTKDYSEELENVINNAYKKGILIVAAAGNNGRAGEGRSTIEYPGVFDNVVTVGATDIVNGMTDSSSTGKELDVVAPGDQVLTDGAFDGVSVDYGTSISAAHVTGLAAVLWGRYPNKTNEFIKGLLVGTANKQAVKDEDCGNGLVDLKAAEKDYSKMNKKYSESIKSGLSEKKAVEKSLSVLPENTSKVESHKEVNYVNGNWGSTTHKGMVSGINGRYIKIVKKGAKNPDKVKGMTKLGKNPYFHGGGDNKDNNGNYLTSTHYILTYAKKLYRGKTQRPSIKEMNKYGSKIKQSEKTHKKEKVYKKTKYSKLKGFFKRCNATKNKQTKAYALLGLAIHNMSDAFSHSVQKEYGVKGHKYYIKVIHDERNAAQALQWKEQRNKKIYSIAVANNYTHLYSKYAIADKRGQMGKMYKIACKIVKRMIKDFNSYTRGKKTKKKWHSNFCKTIPPKGKFILKGIDENWNIFKGKKNIEEKKTVGDEVIPSPEIEVKAKGNNIKIKVSKLKKYCYCDIFAGEKKEKSLKVTYEKPYKRVKKNIKKINYKSKNVLASFEKNKTITVKKPNTNKLTMLVLYGNKCKVEDNIMIID